MDMEQSGPGNEKRNTLEVLKEILAGFNYDSTVEAAEPAQKAAFLAEKLLERARGIETAEEKRLQHSLARLVRSPGDKVTMMKLTDQSFRSKNPQRVADQMVHLLKAKDIPAYLEGLDRTLLGIFTTFGHLLPGVSVPLVKKKMRSTSENLILAAEPEPLRRHLKNRYSHGVRMNVNFLGEAVLGEGECRKRIQQYIDALRNPDVEVISIKISTIYSQISPVSAAHTIDTLCGRLREILEEAKQHNFTRHDGTVVPKLVYLDMEEYRDMFLTAEVFMKTLDMPGMENVAAGIALQAYVPDSFLTQQRINEWAVRHTEKGGSPVTIRIVKGANLEMERTDASIHGWPQAPYREKIHTDANFKRMLHEGLKRENIEAVRLGVASHNLFDIAYGMIRAMDNECLDMVQFEMLEGMADHICRALNEITGSILLYAPATRREDFISAIGYLVRRLDENTGPDNFMSHSFELNPGTDKWRKLRHEFYSSFDLIDEIETQSRRKQNRLEPLDEESAAAHLKNGFDNEPDTDFSLPENQRWAERIVAEWKDRSGDNAEDIPLVVAGAEITEDREVRECADPSRPGVVVGRYRQANAADIDAAVECARNDEDGWRSKTAAQRADALASAAMEFRRSRAELIGAAMADGGKLITESDPEVSEAIDFLEYYPRSVEIYDSRPNLECAGRGVAVVVSPWNFPIAIPSGGVSAALAAGNTVILKPASDSVLVAYKLCECYWRAGISRKTLQFVPCSGGREGARLVSHKDVDIVILTGGTDTALRMLRKKPDMNLYAETGGKNATIVTAMSDRDQAVKNILHSAFSHSGQKCSATSLLILEDEVYNDADFLKQLKDAIESMRVGQAWELHTKMGPLIKPPSGDLKHAMENLEDGESWLIEPQSYEDNPSLWGPAVKMGVKPGSHCHMNELFGPVLSVMKARSLDEAIDIVNSTGFGLTSGIESLDERETAKWKESIRAGNLYVNRVTTGAVVLRQPFGGMGKSAFGPGVKVGGPNYTALLMNFRETDLPEGSQNIRDPELEKLRRRLLDPGEGDSGVMMWEVEKIVAAIRSYDRAGMEEFYRMHDHFMLRGQDNFRRYLPVGNLIVRLHPDDSFFQIMARLCAARVMCCGIVASCEDESDIEHLELIKDLTKEWGENLRFEKATDGELSRMLFDGAADRIRYAAPDRVPALIHASAAETGAFVAREPVLMDGRVELLWYLREQSISDNYHRYGNLGERSEEDCAPVM